MHYLTKAGVKFINESGYPQLRLKTNRNKQLKNAVEQVAGTERGKRLVKAAEVRTTTRFPGLGKPDTNSREAYLDKLKASIGR
tara:strand:+ start:934 stop:1182 length:249 start_codon:yes stop_codon:yes gene_type:complete